MLMSIAIGQTIIDYRGLEIQSPDPTGAAGLRLQNNFKALADRIGPSNLTATGTPSVDDDVDEGYYAGSLWYDTVGGVLYWCADNTDGAMGNDETRRQRTAGRGTQGLAINCAAARHEIKGKAGS